MIGLLWVMLGITVANPLDYDFDYSPVEQVSTQTIQHLWYASWDTRQLMVQRAYELGWIDFVTMIECESWFNPNARGDSGRAYGLCQINNRRHNVSEEYKNSWEVQIDTCYQKWESWTRFYGPTRKINGQLCKDYVLDRFIIKSWKGCY